MQQDLIGYDEIIENSMRSVIFETLKKIEKSGLPGKHYFIVTFLTSFPEVSISKVLKEKYPEEMTIAIQYQFKSLVVDEDLFKISLSFGGKFEHQKAYKNLYTSKDYVDIIAPMILKSIKSNFVGIINIGTSKKNIYEYAKNRLKNVDYDFLSTPKDFSLNTKLYESL